MDKKLCCERKCLEYGFKVQVYKNNDLMGEAAAKDAAKLLKKYTTELKKEVLCVFAAAPSQDTFLSHLSQQKDIDWTKVSAFHLDEYLDLPRNHPNTFEVYLRNNVFEKINIPESNVSYIKSVKGTPVEISNEYGNTFKEAVKKVKEAGGVYLAFIGIGVNGHIAFNEPGSEIYSSKWFLPIEIDEVSVKQQFDDYKNHLNPAARYATLEDVPRRALTMSCASILEADKIFVIVPGEQKADAVQQAIEGPITSMLPASVLRQHHSTILYLDNESAEKLNQPPTVEK
jgi:glucosamine-6-phosphate deaminase